MSALKAIRDFFIYGNVWIGLCAVAQGLLTFKLIHREPSSPVCFILFFATFLIYNIRIVFNQSWVEQHKQEGTSVAMHWMAHHARILLGLSLIALTCIVPFAWMLKWETVFVFFITALLALAYSLPVFPKRGGLRQVPGLKTFLVGVVWAMSTVLVPLVESNVPLDSIQAGALFLKRFILIFILAFLFDIRDEQTDRKKQLHTLATCLGAAKSRVLCVFLLLLELLLIYLYDYNTDRQVFLALSVFTLLSLLVVWKAKENKEALYYLFVVDGMMVLQYILVSIALL